MDANSPKLVSQDTVLTQLRTLKSDLAERYTLSKIGIFGSIARDAASADSDIDVVVHMQPDMLKRACLKAELEDLFGRKVDVIRYWYGMNPYLKRRIDQDAIYV